MRDTDAAELEPAPEAVFDSVERVPAYRIAERVIRSKILDGSLSPGMLLPPETALAEQMGVTRPMPIWTEPQTSSTTRPN